MAPLPSRYWQDLGTQDFAAHDMARVLTVLPVSAVEQHGPHLPVSVDADINDGILSATLERLPADFPVLALPPQTIGKSDEHNRFPGTLSISAETLIRHWNDIGDSVARAGVRKIVFFNSHGGNPPVMEIVARDLRVRHGMLAVTANWWDLVDLQVWFDAEEVRHGIHGGAIETSIMLHLSPDRVDMAKAGNFPSAGADAAASFARLSPDARPGYAWETQDLNPSGAVGDAAAGTADKGARIVAAAAQGLAELLGDVEQFDLARLAVDGSGQ
jgi:creatinine amidohydrolase